MIVNIFLKIVIVLVLLPFLFVARASAEPYVSKDFPPNEVIVKDMPKVNPQWTKANANLKILGKTGKDNEFTVFIEIRQVGGPGGLVLRLTLIRLDTNLWIFTPGGGEPQILENSMIKFFVLDSLSS